MHICLYYSIYLAI